MIVSTTAHGIKRSVIAHFAEINYASSAGINMEGKNPTIES